MHGDFDERAATWDEDPAKVERGQRVADAAVEAVDLDDDARLLEYGAGTGLASQALVGRVGAVTLTDPSAGMRNVMQAKVDEGVFPAGTRVWDLDLARDGVPDERFDLVLAVMSLHHVGTPGLATVLERMAGLLEPTGSLCIVDLEEDAEGSFHEEQHDFDGFHGFRHADLAGRLAAAGFTDVEFTPCGTVHRNGAEFDLFLAVARPAAS